MQQKVLARTRRHETAPLCDLFPGPAVQGANADLRAERGGEGDNKNCDLSAGPGVQRVNADLRAERRGGENSCDLSPGPGVQRVNADLRAEQGRWRWGGIKVG
jgi:hypothetical protein